MISDDTRLAPAPLLENWTGAWIWTTAKAAETRNDYAFFRRCFDTKTATTVRVRITADSFYWLYVDGEFRGRGPARAPLAWYLVDEYALELPAGPHAIAVLVHHVGEVNATMMKGRPGLLLEAAVGEICNQKPPAWQAGRSHSHS